MKLLLKRRSGTIEFWKNVFTGLIGKSKHPPIDVRKERYGESDEQIFDLWYGEISRTKPSPVLIFFHGGGFIRGHRFYSKLLRQAHQRGATVISAGYRLSSNKKYTIEDSIKDAAHLVVYLKKNAEKYRIDPNQIAACGNSAGGVMSLSLAIRKNINDVEVCDNSIVCGVTHNSPTLLDPFRFKELMGLDSIQQFWYLWSHLFNISELEEAKSDEVKQLIANVSPELHIHKQASPLYLEYSEAPPEDGRHTYERDSLVSILHSCLFGIEFMKKAKDVEADCILSYPGCHQEVSAIDFIFKHFQREN